jgi:hypothetical protein
VAAWIYTGIATPSLVLGTIYLFRPTFMPYHAIALGKEWAELDAATQVLIKALMEVAAGGWLALGTLMLLLVAFPIRRGERWARWAAPTASLLFYVPTLLATLSVLQQTPALARQPRHVRGFGARLLARRTLATQPAAGPKRPRWRRRLRELVLRLGEHPKLHELASLRSCEALAQN